MKIRYIFFGLGITLCLLGLAGVLSIFYYNNRGEAQPITGVQIQAVPAKPETISGKPLKLNIASLNMKLAVTDGKYNEKTGEWTLSKDKVHFAQYSLPPNDQEGNTLIYGHYRRNVFASLKNIKKGDKAVVTTGNGYRFIYQFESSETVWPTDTSIFDYKGEPQLTLQTCTGAFFQDRQLFKFSFVKVEKV